MRARAPALKCHKAYCVDSAPAACANGSQGGGIVVIRQVLQRRGAIAAWPSGRIECMLARPIA